MNADVIIIGAGAAGLAAAERLSAAKLKVLVLEARNRIGGRIYTVRTGDRQIPIELGAEFIHGEPLETLEIVRAANLPIRKSSEASWEVGESGELVESGGENSNEDEIWRKLEEYAGEDLSFAAFLEKYFDAPKYAAARQSVGQYVGGFHAAELARASVLGIKRTEKADPDATAVSFQFPAGYDGVIDWLSAQAAAHGAEIRLNSPIKKVLWENGAAVVSLKNSAEILTAKQIVVTVPLGVLQTGAIEFEPVLPVEKQTALQHLELGAALRVTIRFREKWWTAILAKRSGGKTSELGFVSARREKIPVWWTSEPAAANLLTGWAGGAKAAALSNRSAAEIIGEAVAVLANIFGAEKSFIENQIESAHTYDWQTDEFALGSYTYLLTNGLNAPLELAKPLADTVFFAGEATNFDGHWGTVHGAIATGQRAAREILAMR